MKKKLRIGLTFGFSIVTIFFLSLTIYRWSWNYNEMGIYFDEETMTTYDNDARLVFGVLTIFFLILTLILLRSFRSEVLTGKFRFQIFFIAFFAITFLTMLSWLFAFGKDEGQIDESTEKIQNFIADSFNFFRLPVHGLLEPWILSDGIGWYFSGLMINVVFWSLLTERIFSIAVKLLKRDTAESA